MIEIPQNTYKAESISDRIAKYVVNHFTMKHNPMDNIDSRYCSVPEYLLKGWSSSDALSLQSAFEDKGYYVLMDEDKYHLEVEAFIVSKQPFEYYNKPINRLFN